MHLTPPRTLHAGARLELSPLTNSYKSKLRSPANTQSKFHWTKSTPKNMNHLHDTCICYRDSETPQNHAQTTNHIPLKILDCCLLLFPEEYGQATTCICCCYMKTASTWTLFREPSAWATLWLSNQIAGCSTEKTDWSKEDWRAVMARLSCFKPHLAKVIAFLHL